MSKLFDEFDVHRKGVLLTKFIFKVQLHGALKVNSALKIK